MKKMQYLIQRYNILWKEIIFSSIRPVKKIIYLYEKNIFYVNASYAEYLILSSPFLHLLTKINNI